MRPKKALHVRDIGGVCTTYWVDVPTADVLESIETFMLQNRSPLRIACTGGSVVVLAPGCIASIQVEEERPDPIGPIGPI